MNESHIFRKKEIEQGKKKSEIQEADVKLTNMFVK